MASEHDTGKPVAALLPWRAERRALLLTAELRVQCESLPGPVAGSTQPLDLTSNGAAIPAALTTHWGDIEDVACREGRALYCLREHYDSSTRHGEIKAQ